ncbi:Type 1 glutamine amidotransferase-like domain-containing protein [Candidatus Dojkabacteria bacterium]|nr:Type 1 glutamine amidotransferase-like domain-containing protein [Candidatus Dojkabacteria bacterium]
MNNIDVKKLKLFVCSTTITSRLLPKFEDFVGRKADGMKVAFIPDGALAEEGSEKWINEFQNSLKKIGFKLTEYHLGKVQDKNHSSLLAFDAILVAGGSS